MTTSDLEHRTAEKYYTVRAECTNCNWTGALEIKLGQPFTNARVCPGCQCRWTLMRRFS